MAIIRIFRLYAFPAKYREFISARIIRRNAIVAKFWISGMVAVIYVFRSIIYNDVFGIFGWAHYIKTIFGIFYLQKHIPCRIQSFLVICKPSWNSHHKFLKFFLV